MKKKLMVLVAALATLSLALVLVGCSSGGDTAKKDGGDTAKAEKVTLTVGFDQGYPPYGFIDDAGEFVGFDLDLAAEVCKRNDWELKLEPIDWDAKDALLNSGAISCIWNGFTYEGREDKYAWSKPYMLNEQVVVVKADSGIASMEDLKDKIVITQVESAALDVLEGDQADLAASFKELQTIGDYNSAFMQLETGMVQAVACDLSIAEYQIAAKPGVYTKVGALSSEHYAVGFKLGDEATAQTVTDTLKAMYEDGTVKELCEKYADYGMSFDNWVLK